MQFEVDFIKTLQGMSNTVVDYVGQAASLFGTELFFMIVAMILYWCVDKVFAFKMFNSYILGVAANNGLKAAFKRARPFDAYPDQIKSIGDPEKTYSYPSGHTSSIASISTLLTIKYGKKHKAVPIFFGLLTVLVMLSRMYLGQHYLSDVLCGLTSGIFFAIAFNFLISLFKSKEEFMIIPAVVISAVVIGVLWGMNLLEGNEDVMKGMGAFLAFDIGYFVEKRYVKYDVKEYGKGSNYFARVVLGGGILIGIQYGFKMFLPESNIMLYCFLRYFVMGLWASLIAPFIFKAAKL